MRYPVATALFLGGTLALFGLCTPQASAHDWRHHHDYGLGAHDFVPHWHTYVTPYGSYSAYGLGAHDFVPHGHFYAPFQYGGYNPAPVWPYAGGPAYYGPPSYFYRY